MRIIKSPHILVTGASGMIGSAFHRNPRHKEFIFVDSRDCDLTDKRQTMEMFHRHRPSAVIHLAAKVGGLLANINNMADFYLKNIEMNTNILEASREHKVTKVVSLLSTCVYPDECTYPLTEDQIHTGAPHESNYGYAYAKRMLDVQSRAYRKQYGCNFITAIPNNLYGKFDNFDLKESHVIPAMIRKIHAARDNNANVVLWGSGSPIREFTYSCDLANILLFLLDKYNDSDPINVGNTESCTIKELSKIISEKLGFSGEIVWDKDKPDGQHKKPSDNSRFISLGWKQENYTSLHTGLDRVIDWYERSYPMVRGLN